VLQKFITAIKLWSVSVVCGCRCWYIELIVICIDGGGDRPTPDGESHIPDAMTQRLEALAKRLAIEQKVNWV